MIKDMRACRPIYKYVDDSTLFEIINKTLKNRQLQIAMDDTVRWTQNNAMVLNHEMVHGFEPMKWLSPAEQKPRRSPQ